MASSILSHNQIIGDGTGKRKTFKRDSAMDLYELTESELLVAYQDAIDAVRERLRDPHTSYASLADEIQVREDSLKKFVAREQEVLKSGKLRRGAVFSKVHKTLVAKNEILNVPENRVLSDRQRLVGYKFIAGILGIGGNTLRNAEKIVLEHGHYICIRNSTDGKTMSVSELSFNNLGTEGEPVWEFDHSFTEGDDAQAHSDGPVLMMGRNIYLFGDVNLGNSLEIIVIRMPRAEPRFVSGLMFSHDDEGIPLVANIVLIPIREYKGKEKLDPLDIRNITEQTFIAKGELMRASYGEDKSFGKNLVKQLQIDGNTPVLRMRRERMVESFTFDQSPKSRL